MNDRIEKIGIDISISFHPLSAGDAFELPATNFDSQKRRIWEMYKTNSRAVQQINWTKRRTSKWLIVQVNCLLEVIRKSCVVCLINLKEIKRSVLIHLLENQLITDAQELANLFVIPFPLNTQLPNCIPKAYIHLRCYWVRTNSDIWKIMVFRVLDGS